MRSRQLRSLLPALAVLSLALSARHAAAADCDPQSHASTCFDADNLWHHAGPAQFVTVGSTALIPPGQMGFGLMTSYQRRPVVLRLSSAEPGGTDVYAIDNQVNASLLWSLGVTDWLQVHAVAPVTLYQTGVGTSPLTQQESAPIVRSTVRDVRLGGTFGLLPRKDGFRSNGFGLSARAEVALPSGDEGVFAGNRGFTFAPTLTADYRIGPVLIGVEAGMRTRKASEIVGTRIGSQAYEAIGVSVDVLPDEKLSVSAEAFSLQGLTKSYALVRQNGQISFGDTRPLHAPTEWMVALRSSPTRSGDLSVHLGGGSSIPLTDNNVTAPALRFIGGVRYAPLGRDTDGDGIPDAQDACPNEPEDKDGFQDSDGCPDPDNDGDGIPDAKDKCRDAAEDFDGFQDDDGCPDLDNDDDGIPDTEDQCPNEPEDRDGFQDDDGCPDPDNDGDGIPDAKDMCPNGAEDFDGFRDEDGCPDPDNDNDGIPDIQDKCPNEPEDKDGFQDEDGCPDPDNDNDGILDKQDKCPNEPETINGIEDEDGCPEPGAKDEVSVDKAGRVVTTTPIRFAAGQAKMTPAIEKNLRMAAQKARSIAGLERLIVETYGDAPTPTAKQEALAERRAEAVRTVLLAAGFTADNITVATGDIAAKRSANASHVELLTVRKREK